MSVNGAYRIAAALVLGTLLLAGCGAGGRVRTAHTKTEWLIRAAPVAYEAIAFLDVLAGDPAGAGDVAADVAAFRERATPEVEEALDRLGALQRAEGVALSSRLAPVFSARSPETLDDLVALAGDPSVLRQLNRTAEGGAWELADTQWSMVDAALPDLKTTFTFLRNVDFPAYLEGSRLTALHEQAAVLQAFAEVYNPVRAVEGRTHRPLPDQRLTVYVSHFSRSTTLKITGMRFITESSTGPEELVRSIVRDLLQPPFDWQDQALWGKVSTLKDDPFLSLEEESFEGDVQSASVDALEQIISESMRIGAPPQALLEPRRAGAGAALAAALYELMEQEEFIHGSESYQGFLVRMIDEGKLAPGKVEPLYRQFEQRAAAN